jgi:zinc protease
MLGYTKPTWFGYGGWGVLDYFIEQPGRYTLTQAFFANHHALVHRLGESGTSNGDKRGLAFDRDVVAFYGDPAWSAKLAPGKLAYGQKLSSSEGVYTFEIEPRLGAASFDTVNTNGSQRGGRPFVGFLDHRVEEVKLMEGQDLSPVIADDFVLIPRPAKCDPSRSYRVIFRASRVK